MIGLIPDPRDVYPQPSAIARMWLAMAEAARRNGEIAAAHTFALLAQDFYDMVEP